MLFLIYFVSYAFLSADEEKTYSLIAKLTNSAAITVLWPLLLLGTLILLIIEIRVHYAKSNGPSCGFRDTYFYRQLPGYIEPVVAYSEEQNAGDKSEYLPLLEWMFYSKDI